MGDLKVAARSLTGEGGIIMQLTTRNPTCLVTRSDGLHASFDEVKHAVM